MPSLENWEWGLNIFDGAPTLTTHVYTIHTHIKSLLAYIINQTTHLHGAKLNDKVVHAAVIYYSISYPTTRGGSHVKSNDYRISSNKRRTSNSSRPRINAARNVHQV